MSALRRVDGGMALMFRRFGPYHVARACAAARRMKLTGMQLWGETEEYCREAIHGEAQFKLVTVMRGREGMSAAHEFTRRIRDLLDAERPSVVAIPGWSDWGALYGLKWCLRNQVPAILMSESTARDERRTGVREWVKGRVVRLFSAGLVGGSPQAEYVAELGMARGRIFTGYDAVDNLYFADSAEKVRATRTVFRKRFGLPENYFMASGRFIAKKNLPHLLEAYARYRAMAGALAAGKPGVGAGGVWDLVLVGDGELRGELRLKRRELGLEGHVQMPGFKQYKDLPVYYGLARVFVHASSTEQWGLVVNEAMASGLPVLVSNRCGCARDLVAEGVNGFTFDPCNLEELSELMLSVSSFGPKLSAMGRESQRIVGQWGTERFGSALRAAAEKALEVGPRQPSAMDRALLWALTHRRSVGGR